MIDSMKDENTMSEVEEEPGSTELSLPVKTMMEGLEWAYSQASAHIPGLGSAEDLGESHLKSCGNSVEAAIDDLIMWQTGYAATAGFVTNLGGLITLPVAVPVNLASVLLIQLRMIAAIAHLRGYNIKDPQVRTLAFLSLTGSAAATILQDFGVKLGTKLTTSLIMQISGKTLTRINQAVGFRLVTKAGSTGLVNLTKMVPFVGGFVGGGFDAVVTRGIGEAARRTFTTIVDEPDPEGEASTSDTHERPTSDEANGFETD